MGDILGDINSRRGRISGTDTLDDATIGVTVEHIGQTHTATIQPTSLGHRLVFINKCTCGQAGCAGTV